MNYEDAIALIACNKPEADQTHEELKEELHYYKEKIDELFGEELIGKDWAEVFYALGITYLDEFCSYGSFIEQSIRTPEDSNDEKWMKAINIHRSAQKLTSAAAELKRKLEVCYILNKLNIQIGE